jgi:hypothetical protein
LQFFVPNSADVIALIQFGFEQQYNSGAIAGGLYAFQQVKATKTE